MKKSTFIAMMLGTIGGIFPALDLDPADYSPGLWACDLCAGRERGLQ